MLPPEDEKELEKRATTMQGNVKFDTDALGTIRIIRDPAAEGDWHGHSHEEGHSCALPPKTVGRRESEGSNTVPTPLSTPSPMAAPARRYTTADFTFLKVLGQGSYGKVRL